MLPLHSPILLDGVVGAEARVSLALVAPESLRGLEIAPATNWTDIVSALEGRALRLRLVLEGSRGFLAWGRVFRGPLSNRVGSLLGSCACNCNSFLLL